MTNRALITAVVTDIHFLIPLGVIALGIVLLIAMH